MTDSRKLKGRIVEKGFTMTSFSEALHISRPTLRKKISGQSEFMASEIEKICSVLDIQRNDMCGYFFTDFVPEMETTSKEKK